MSSRLYPKGAKLEIRPLAWRSPGSPPVHDGQRSRDPVSPPAQAPSDVDARIRAAFEQGFAEGEAVGHQRASERVAPVLKQFAALTEALAGEKRRLVAEAEDSMVQLSIAIARRVLHREVSTDPEAILGLIHSAAGRLNARETQRLRVAPSDAAVIHEHRNRLNLPAAMEISADTQLAPGSAVFETSRGEMDASAGTQLDEIERGLADLVRRRLR